MYALMFLNTFLSHKINIDRAHSTACFGEKSKLLLFFKHVWLAFLYVCIYYLLLLFILKKDPKKVKTKSNSSNLKKKKKKLPK